jgi:hypothetical protein
MRLSRKPSAIRRRRAFVAVVLLLAAGVQLDSWLAVRDGD